MIIDFRRHVLMHEVTSIEGQTVEQSMEQSYKYLRTIIDSKLNLAANCEAVCKKGHQCLFRCPISTLTKP